MPTGTNHLFDERHLDIIPSIASSTCDQQDSVSLLGIDWAVTQTRKLSNGIWPLGVISLLLKCPRFSGRRKHTRNA